MSEIREAYCEAVAAHRAGGCERCGALVSCPVVWELLAEVEAVELRLAARPIGEVEEIES